MNKYLINLIEKIFFKIKRLTFEKFIFKSKNKKKVFEKIYKYKYWGSKESISGPGSNLKRANNLITNLPNILKKYQIETIFDAPCGDLNWIMEILNQKIIKKYIGGDIVEELINQNKLKKFNTDCNFLVFDITKDNFPKSDLWICRDILYHFSYEDIFKTLNNFVNSDVKYILLSNCIVDNAYINKDINTGDYRDIILYKSPFNFEDNSLEKIKDVKFDTYKEEMCLWTKEQIKSFLSKNK